MFDFELSESTNELNKMKPIQKALILINPLLQRFSLLLFIAAVMGGCNQKPNMGSPVGKWGVFDALVTFVDDGSVAWQNDGQEFNPEFLAPLEEGKPGTWKTDGFILILTAKDSDGTSATGRYKYSVGSDEEGNPALEIYPEGSNEGGYILKKQ